MSALGYADLLGFCVLSLTWQKGNAGRKPGTASSIKFEWIPTVFLRFYVLRSSRGWPERSRLTRHEDFQSSDRTETICRYRSLFVSIQAFNAGLSRSILPIRTHSGT